MTIFFHAPAISLLPRARRSLLLFPLACAAIAFITPVSAAPDKARHQIELFADLAPGDSLAAVRSTAPDTLELEVIPAGKGSRRTTRHFVPPAVLDKILANARLHESHGLRGDDTPVPSARIREDYMGGQMAATIAVYGVGLAAAFQLDGKAALLVPAFAVTSGLVFHSIYSLNNPIAEPQALGMNYAAAASILSSYAVSYAALGSDGNAFRVGAGLSLLAYPLSLRPGYVYGTSFLRTPWELSKKVAGSGAAAALGAALPWVYFEDADADLYLRTAAVQFLAFGAAGNLAADWYRPGERITEGTATGIFTHTTLGALAGSALFATVKPDDSRVGMGIILGSTTAGFAEGLWFFRDRNDDTDRGNYSGFGMAGGLLLSGTIVLTGGMDPSLGLWLMTASGVMGYAIVYRAMGSGEGSELSARAHSGAHARTGAAGLHLAPVPEAVRVTDLRTGRSVVDVRYRVPGLVVRF